MSDPNVVANHNIGEIGDEVFIIMELLEGVTWQRRLTLTASARFVAR